jgi:hypothetical protein
MENNLTTEENYTVYMDQKHRVGFFPIFSSQSKNSSNGGKSKDLIGYDEDDIAEKGPPLYGIEKDDENIMKILKSPILEKNYILKGKLNLIKDSCQGYDKKFITDSLQNFFNCNDIHSCVLILTGHGGIENFCLELPGGDKNISYDEISEMWLNRTSKTINKQLLIIIDACYSASWVEKCKTQNHFYSHCGISVLASCQHNLTSQDVKGKGGVLIWNFTMHHLLEHDQIYSTDKHEPRSCGFDFIVMKNFGLNLMINSWEDFKNTNFLNRKILKNLPLKLDKVTYNDGDRYEGEFKDGKKNGKGVYY